MHCGVEVTETSTNKQHYLSLSQPRAYHFNSPVSLPHTYQSTFTCPHPQLCHLLPREGPALSHAGVWEYSKKVAVSVEQLLVVLSQASTLVCSSLLVLPSSD
jgi:hypothetical protein